MKWIKEWMGYLTSIAIVVVYVGMAVIGLTAKDKTVGEILAEGFIILALGLSLSRTLGYQGMSDGESDEVVVATKREHANEVKAVEPFWDESFDFCEKMNARALKQVRSDILKSRGLHYEDYFDENGGFKDVFLVIKDTDGEELITLKKTRNKALVEAIKIKITQITPTDLTTETSNRSDPLKRGRTKKSYALQSAVIDSINKVVTSVVGGIYGASFIGKDMGEIYYRIIIGVLLFALAMLKYYSSKSFIKGEHRERIITSIDWLIEFKNMHNNKELKRTLIPEVIVENKESEVTPNAILENSNDGRGTTQEAPILLHEAG